MHSDGSKSYRRRKPVAPYGEPINSTMNKKKSFFSKLKTWFQARKGPERNWNDPVTTESRVVDNRSENVPGAFFNGDAQSLVSNKSRLAEEERQEETFGYPDKKELLDQEIEDTVDSSNTTLAKFFSEKGDRPLTDVEMEGVLSLMRKARNKMNASSNSSFVSFNANGDLGDSETPHILKTTMTPRSYTGSLTSFTPKYEGSTPSSTLHGTRNGSISSARRVFDYSRMPSPYKTTIYKYTPSTSQSMMEKSLISAPGKISKGSKYGNKMGNGTGKKSLSNTATALVSLLDNPGLGEKPLSNIANPYSSQVSHLRKPRQHTTGISPETPQLSKESKKAPVRQESVSLDEGKLEAQNDTKNLHMYKPLKSSSLRDNVVIAENESPEKMKDSEVTDKKIKMNHTPAFNFGFQKEKNKTNKVAPFPTAEGVESMIKPSSLSSRNDKPSKINNSKSMSFSENKNATKTIEVPSRKDAAKSLENQTNDTKLNVDTNSLEPHPKTISSKEYTFDFGTLEKSESNVTNIDKNKVEQFKGLFIF